MEQREEGGGRRPGRQPAGPLHEDLSWSTNLTYMLQSKDKDTGNPLSVIPEYTLNSTLDWQASERFPPN